MKKSVNIKIFIVMFILFVTSFFLHTEYIMAKIITADDLSYMTEQYPPFNYEEKGQLQGITVDLLEEIWKRINAGSNRDHIRLVKWTVGYQAVLKEKNTVLFSMTKTPERENLFQWAGPIAPIKIVMIARKNRPLKINSLDDLKGYKVAAVRDDIGEQLLIRGGIKREAIIIRENAEDIIRMMEAGTIDAWAYEETAGLWLIKHTAADPGNYQSIYKLYEGELYFAFNRKTPKMVVQSFQQALNDLKNEKAMDGYSVYEKIFNHYLKPRYVKDLITNEQVIQMVDRTASDFTYDAPGTIQKINSGEHPYRDKDNHSFYALIYDTEVTMTAHGDNIKLVGKNFKGKTDVNGKAFRDEIVAKAQRNGSGWEDYVYTNPGESGLYYKTTYFKLVKGSDGRTYIVCSGKFKDKP
jgi:polar amino acid transport system substrate-binding protein